MEETERSREGEESVSVSPPPRPGLAEGPRPVGWSQILPPPEPWIWLPGFHWSVQKVRLIGVSVLLDALLLGALAWARSSAGGVPVGTAAVLLLVGPGIGFAIEIVGEPVRLGVKPRGLLLRYFPARELSLPWGYLMPEPPAAGHGPQLRFVDPKWMTTHTLTLTRTLTQELVDHPWTSGWALRAEAIRLWGTGTGAPT